MNESVIFRKQIDDLLNLPQQTWLLGAGISLNAGIPLMIPLTDRIQENLTKDDKSLFETIRGQLHESAHVEHVMSHIGDLIAIALRTKGKTVEVGKKKRTAEELEKLHASIQNEIRDIMRWGYVVGNGPAPERVGDKDNPIVSIDGHVAFIKALFHNRRAGLERRPPVALFTTNYDTLLEDALALCRIRASDGFCGGATAFWEPRFEFSSPFKPDDQVQARVYKLHGSIDWVTSSEDIVVRRRESVGYPKESSIRLLIYPQATKYKVTQRDPFASLFAAFRSALMDSEPGLLAICGYSFGDDHINEEIERALKQRDNRLTVLAFVAQNRNRLMETGQGLPEVLVKWLSAGEATWKERIVIAGRYGAYHGSLANKCLQTDVSGHNWWSFEGLTGLLTDGPEEKS